MKLIIIGSKQLNFARDTHFQVHIVVLKTVGPCTFLIYYDEKCVDMVDLLNHLMSVLLLE